MIWLVALWLESQMWEMQSMPLRKMFLMKRRMTAAELKEALDNGLCGRKRQSHQEISVRADREIRKR